MPEVKDIQGNVVAKLPYTDTGMEQAEAMKEANPGLSVDYAPGGQYNGMERMETNYAGSGKTGYNKIGGIPKMPNSPKKDTY